MENKQQGLEKMSEGAFMLTESGSASFFIKLTPQEMVDCRGQIIVKYSQLGNRVRYAVYRKPAEPSQILPEVRNQFYPQPGARAILAKKQLNQLFGE
ncbi:MAG: hypothetical protein M1165_02860 [Candidatus Pacearchaeota archaeon]|nr:hypothetical protein [Candidatus Pacearchaeota archaeon]MDE1848896.1 hypothetical protein [Nanoarchaeota archaeon]